MITIICKLAPIKNVRAIIAAPAAVAILLFLATTTTNAYAEQFSFDPSTGQVFRAGDFALPGLLIGIASLVGALLIINEKRKAKGIWFSNSEKMR